MKTLQKNLSLFQKFSLQFDRDRAHFHEFFSQFCTDFGRIQLFTRPVPSGMSCVNLVLFGSKLMEPFINKHTYVRAYIRTCMHAYLHTYIHAYIHTYMHTYLHTYIQHSTNYSKIVQEETIAISLVVSCCAKLFFYETYTVVFHSDSLTESIFLTLGVRVGRLWFRQWL